MATDMKLKMERRPHVLVFPFPAQGHMIPLLDLIHTLASHGLSLTVLTTPQNQSLLNPLLHTASAEGLRIQPLIIPFPPTQGIPLGCENTGQLPALHLIPLFMYSFKELAQPIEDWFHQQKKSSDGFGPPVCIISDFFLGWTQNTAAKLGIRRIVFHPSGAFAVSIIYSLWKYMPHEQVSSDNDAVYIPDLPHPVSFPKSQISPLLRRYKVLDTIFEFIRYNMDLNVESWGTLINTFYDLEAVYIDNLHRVVSGRPVWSVGPLLPPALPPAVLDAEGTNMIERGKPTSIKESVCLQWLESQKEKSVIYICFGSHAFFSNKQNQEMAAGLEASEESFIWVIRDPPSSMPADEYGVLPQGFEERTKGRGLVIRGWAPQLLILSHPSVGGFLTHCGWNSTLESITSGVPLITWPMTADQYYNAVLVVEYLKVGIRFCEGAATVPNRDDLRIAVKRLMGREGEEMKRAEELMRAGKRAVQEGGSSSKNMEDFVSEVKKLTQRPINLTA
jgi:UDP:flavonoid glycosyltransferase YjiC (YdhE family)